MVEVARPSFQGTAAWRRCVVLASRHRLEVPSLRHEHAACGRSRAPHTLALCRPSLVPH